MGHGGADAVAATTDPQEAAGLLDIRRAAFPSLQQLGELVLEDVCVPLSRLADMITGVVDIARQHGVRACTVAHAADGNLHPVLVNDGDALAVQRAADAIFSHAQTLEGTVPGEHGIGRLKRSWLSKEVGETTIGVFHDIKQTFDPLGLLNPGAVIT